MNPRTLERVGQYEVRRFIDEGAFAWVFEVTDPKFSGRRLALKMLKPDAAKGEEFRRFQNEANWLAGIDDPNIVTIFDFGKDPETGNFFYTMTFVDGMTLKERLKQGHMGLDEAVPLFSGLLEGLEQIHAKNLVHRDIKPANVLLDHIGRGRLSDLGIAREQTEASQTRTGTAVGTALYMSPEQARGKPVDARSDLFSLALTLYECLTGNIIYDHVDSIDSSSGMEVLLYIGSLVIHNNELEIYFPPSRPLPQKVKTVLRKALRVNRDERYATAAEMREALLQAVEEGPQSERNLVPMIAAGAGAFALLAGFLAYQQIILPSQQAARVQQSFEDTRALEAQAQELLEAVKDVEPAPAPELISEAEQRFSRAGSYVLDGEEDLAAGFYPSAEGNLKRAKRFMLEACDVLDESILRERAGQVRSTITSAKQRLEAGGAPQLASSEWERFLELEGALPADDANAAACAAAQARLTLIEAGGEAALAARSVETQLDDAWPRVAEERHREAMTARDLAGAEDIDAPELKRALSKATRLLVRGEIAQGGEDYEAALAQYDEALVSYQLAQRILPAARARAQAQNLLDAMRQDGGDPAEAERLAAGAAAAMQKDDFDEAAKLYSELAERVRSMRADHTQRMTAQDARETASERRLAAASDGAERSASELFSAAQREFDAADAALEAGDSAEAERGFAAATARYNEAQNAAIVALRAADDRGDVARELSDLASGDDCADFGDEKARALCAETATALDAGYEALAALDAPVALERYEFAIETFKRAQAAEERWERTRPRPPELVERRPRRPRVELGKGIAQAFSISASDPNDDPLRYEWRFDDARIDGRGSEIERSFRRSGELSVTVLDGTGESLVERWEIATLNQSPKLSVSPAARNIRIAPFATLRVLSVSEDPDGDELVTRYLLDGREMGRGDYFEFDAGEAEAQYQLRIVTTDSDGAEASADRLITVAAVAADDPDLRMRPRADAPTTEVTPAPKPREPVAVTPPPAPLSAPKRETLPDLGGWEAGVIAALRDYRSALENNDLAALEAVYPMQPSSPIRAFYERKFKRGDRTQVELRLVGSIGGSNRQARVAFDQTETTPARSRTYRYVATMRKGEGGAWQMERRERRQ